MSLTLNGEGPVAATTCLRQADIKIFRNFLKSIDGISYFPYMVALSGLDKVRPPHLTREIFSGHRPADGVVGCVYESFVPGEDCRGLGLRPPIGSRVSAGGRPCRYHSMLPCTGNTICLQCAFLKIVEGLISDCLEHVVAATGPSPFKVGDNQRPERTMSGVRKPSPESSVPGETLTGGKEAESILEGIWKPIRA